MQNSIPSGPAAEWKRREGVSGAVACHTPPHNVTSYRFLKPLSKRMRRPWRQRGLDGNQNKILELLAPDLQTKSLWGAAGPHDADDKEEEEEEERYRWRDGDRDCDGDQ